MLNVLHHQGPWDCKKKLQKNIFEYINVVALSKNVLRNQQKLCWMKKITTKIHP
jgi:hypothetical protein